MATSTPPLQSGQLRTDEDRFYDALLSRDRRFDGQFIAGITSTGIYCRPSCPAPVRPLRRNVTFFPTPAAAQTAGLRSCKRCQPDASPGSPEWDLRSDLVGRAMRRIERGDVDRFGVRGVAESLHVSERHLHRVLTEAVGASPLALARAQRANLARILIETSDMPITNVAFASGFSSVRQFNDTIRAIYDRTPSELRKRRTSTRTPNTAPAEQKTASATAAAADQFSSGVDLTLWLPARSPIDLDWMFDFHCSHSIPGVTRTVDPEGRSGRYYERNLSLTHGTGVVALTTDDLGVRNGPGIWATFSLDNISDLADAIAKVRALFDLDADPQRIAEHLGNDPQLSPFFALRPGVGVPGSVDGFEAAISAIVGQQISVAGARTLLARLVEVHRDKASAKRVLFPTADQTAELDLSSIGLTNRRIQTIRSLATAVASGELVIDIGEDRREIREQLLALPGIGPWTADVISMRALRDPDVMLSSDLVIKARLAELDIEQTTKWAPWRSYVACTLWATRDRKVAR